MKHFAEHRHTFVFALGLCFVAPPAFAQGIEIAAPDGPASAGWAGIARNGAHLSTRALKERQRDSTLPDAPLRFALPPGAEASPAIVGEVHAFDGRLSRQALLEGTGWAMGGHGTFANDSGLYLQTSNAWLAKTSSRNPERIHRQHILGRSKTKGWAVSGELGWELPAGDFAVTPFAAIDYVKAKLEGHVQAGEAAAEGAFAERRVRTLTTSLGGEVARDLGALRPALRAGYSLAQQRGREALASAESDCAFAELRLAMRSGAVSGFVSGGSRWGRGDDDARVSLGLSYGF